MTTQVTLQPQTGDWPKGQWPARDWPVNEIVLQSLVLAGKTDREIAMNYGVDPDAVASLRANFGL